VAIPSFCAANFSHVCNYGEYKYHGRTSKKAISKPPLLRRGLRFNIAACEQLDVGSSTFVSKHISFPPRRTTIKLLPSMGWL